MSTNERSARSPLPARPSPLWVYILFNMVFADVLTFTYPGYLREVLTGTVGGVHITAGFLVAAVITIAYVIGGSTRYPHAIFFTAVQVACALLIVWSAWKLRSPATSTVPAAGVDAVT